MAEQHIHALNRYFVEVCIKTHKLLCVVGTVNRLGDNGGAVCECWPRLAENFYRSLQFKSYSRLLSQMRLQLSADSPTLYWNCDDTQHLQDVNLKHEYASVRAVFNTHQTTQYLYEFTPWKRAVNTTYTVFTI